MSANRFHLHHTIDVSAAAETHVGPYSCGSPLRQCELPLLLGFQVIVLDLTQVLRFCSRCTLTSCQLAIASHAVVVTAEVQWMFAPVYSLSTIQF